MIGTVVGRRLSPIQHGLGDGGARPDARGAARGAQPPNYCFKIDAALWLGGVLVFFAVNAPTDLGARAARRLDGLPRRHDHLRHRPPAARARAGARSPSSRWRPGRRRGRRGRASRAGSCWPGCSPPAAALLGLITLGIDGLIHDVPAEELARGTLVLGARGRSSIGAGVMFVDRAADVARRSTPCARRSAACRRATSPTEVRGQRRQRGRLRCRAASTRWSAGLRERERMQDLYSRQVGEDVAREALAAEPRLGGEVREVAVLFVDIIGSTTLAIEAPPERVVARLNRFFSVVVEVTAEHGGWVNKFEGDAALCVFGAPTATEDPAGCALAAGRDAAARASRRDVPGLEAAHRPVAPAPPSRAGSAPRSASSTRSSATRSTSPRGCASWPSASTAGCWPPRRSSPAPADGERARWTLGETEVLRGRSTPTQLARPVSSAR